jgi:hypothetical protein
MKDVRAIFVNKDPCLVHPVIGVAGNVAPPVYDQNAFVALRGNALRQGCACKSSTDNDPVKHAQSALIDMTWKW